MYTAIITNTQTENLQETPLRSEETTTMMLHIYIGTMQVSTKVHATALAILV